MVEHITINKLRVSIGVPPLMWEGECHTVAHHVQLLWPEAILTRGHWYGVKLGYWTDIGTEFTPHSWNTLPDGTIVDATRWSFENADPYVFIGHDRRHYDPGGNRLRAIMQRPVPRRTLAPNYSVSGLSDDVLALIVALVEPENEWQLDIKQMFWIANLPTQALQPFAREVYGWIERNGLKTFIPMDNYAIAERIVYENHTK